MAHENTVLKSINLHGEYICVDLFQRPDGSYGFDEFRRDPEDGRGWYSLRHLGHQRFDTKNAALAEALVQVPWLKNALG